MARYTGPVVKLCRREGVNLFDSEKVAKHLAKRPYGPGQHGQRRKSRPSDFGIRLREKQKLRLIYGMGEKQFRNLFEEANRMQGVTGTIFLQLLESRLDNVVYRLGLATTRRQARQFVGHGHLLVNGKRVDVASYRIKPSDTIAIAESAKGFDILKANIEGQRRRKSAPWLQFNPETMTGQFVRLPAREDIAVPVNEQFIIEYYSR
jgi:small subunit ribosomal protein S4